MKRIILNNKLIMVFLNKMSSILFVILQWMIPIKDNRILFISFGGESIGDSPREIYGKMLIDERFSDFEFIWAVNNKLNLSDEISYYSKVINSNRISYFYYLFSSSIWITNVGMGRGLNVSPKDRLFINTWHGTPVKKIGSDVDNRIHDNKSTDRTYYTYQSEYEKEIFLRVFPVKEKNLLPVGLPRNDLLFNHDEQKINELKNKLGIPKNNSVILYAPTWRKRTTTPYLDLEKFRSNLNPNITILFRGHHAMTEIYGDLKFHDNLINVSNYESVTDLLIISNILITDYSSIMVDYSILKKPVLLYISDYKEYQLERGLYFDLFSDFKENCFIKQEEITQLLNEGILDPEKYYLNIVNKFQVYGGGAASKIVDLIYKECQNE